MQLQGYVEPVGRSHRWATTEEGERFRVPSLQRFTHEAIEQALSTLSDRIRANNDGSGSPYAISEAVAFGDFLSEQPRVQAAGVGIRLTPRKAVLRESGLAKEHKAEAEFLNQLRRKSALIHTQAYEEWSARSHRKLL